MRFEDTEMPIGPIVHIEMHNGLFNLAASAPSLVTEYWVVNAKPLKNGIVGVLSLAPLRRSVIKVEELKEMGKEARLQGKKIIRGAVLVNGRMEIFEEIEGDNIILKVKLVEVSCCSESGC